MPSNDNQTLMKRSRLVSLLIMMSRLLGLVREQLLAALLAAGPAAEAYHIAFRIPNLLRDLFAEGALSAAFVPTFARVLEKDGKAQAFVLAQRVLGVLLIVVGALTLAAYVFTEPLVDLLAPGFGSIPGKAELTVSLTRIMLPFLLFLSCAAVAMGALNAQHIYGPPASASSAFNVVAIVFGATLYFLGFSPEQTAVGWSIGVVLGGLAQFSVQLPALARTGFSLRFRFQLDDNVKAILKLMAPATVGLAATQINLVVGSRLASDFPGAVAWLNYAFRLLYLPIGVFGVAIATVSTSNIARLVATNDHKKVREVIRQSLGLIGFLTIPSSVGLIVLSEPIIAMIYQRRAFGSADTAAVASATAAYSLGLFAYSSVKIVAPVFYAQKRPRVPLIASACAVAANILVAVLLRQHFGFVAMAAGTAAAAWVNVIVLHAMLDKTPRQERGAQWNLVVSLGKTTIASAVMGVVGVWLVSQAKMLLPMTSELQKWAVGLGLTALCGVVFVGAAALLAIPEAAIFTSRLRRRIKK